MPIRQHPKHPKGSKFKAGPDEVVNVTFTAWACTFATNCAYCSHYVGGKCGRHVLGLLKSVAQTKDQVASCSGYEPRGRPRRKALVGPGV